MPTCNIEILYYIKLQEQLSAKKHRNPLMFCIFLLSRPQFENSMQVAQVGIYFSHTIHSYTLIYISTVTPARFSMPNVTHLPRGCLTKNLILKKKKNWDKS